MTNLYIKDVSGKYRPADRSVIIATARDRIAQIFERGPELTMPSAAKEYIQMELVEERNEVFACLFLDNSHRVIRFQKLFQGTIDGTAVYPRVVVQRVLEHNAAAVIFAHNHPSGRTDPSPADRAITQKLIEALKVFDIRVLDHLVVGGNAVCSFAEKGLI